MLLVVDDSLPNRYATVRLLSNAGYDVREAATGAEALRLARLRPNLVVLDLRLPDLNGFEVCHHLKADPFTASIPVLMKTAVYGDDSHRTEGLRAGAAEFLAEPVPPPHLLAVIERLLGAGATSTS